MSSTLNIDALESFVATSEALRKALGLARDVQLSLEPLGQGEYNANFILKSEVGKFVARVPLGSQMQLKNQISYEMGALKLLAASGRTPRPLFVAEDVPGLPFGMGIEELLFGRPLDYTSDLREAAAILADIHATPVDASLHLLSPQDPLAAILDECRAMWAHYAQWHKARPVTLRKVEAFFTEARKLLARAPQELSQSRHIINTELNSGNFLINDGGVSHLVDWEKPLWSEIEQDLGHFLAPTTTRWKSSTILSKEERASFVETYWEFVNGRFSRPQSSARLDAYVQMTCLRGISWCAMAYRQYKEGTSAAHNVGVLDVLSLYLSDDFLDHIYELCF